MTDSSDYRDLCGKMLIAMPGMGDPRFDKSVVYLCAHTAEGSMGLIVNKPAPDVKFSDMLEQLKIPKGDMCFDATVHFGGPVEKARGFVLHSGDYVANESTLQVNDQFGMTGTLDILTEMAQGDGPEQRFLALGYAGWGPGQLDSEIHRNGWLTCDAVPEIVFGKDDSIKWNAALQSMGIDPMLLSAEAGHA